MLVIGCGMIGLGAIAAAGLDRGARVIAVDVDDIKLSLARECGATEVINSHSRPLEATVLEMTGGHGAGVVIEAVGLPQTFRAAVQVASFAGRERLYWLREEAVSYEAKYFVMKEIDILGSAIRLQRILTEWQRCCRAACIRWRRPFPAQCRLRPGRRLWKGGAEIPQPSRRFISRFDGYTHRFTSAFWKYSPEEYGWIGPDQTRIRRDFLPEDLQKEIGQVGIDGVVAVQARTTLEEVYWLATLAGKYPFIRGVVGWVPLCDQRLEGYLAGLEGKLCGVREVCQGQAEGFMLRSAFVSGVRPVSGFRTVLRHLDF